MGRLTQIKSQLSKATPLVGRCEDIGTEAARTANAPWRKWYRTMRWKRLRMAVLIRHLFTCKICGRLEGNTGLLVCDHVKPHRGLEQLFWDEANLQCLCKPCHDEIKQKQEQSSMMDRGVWY